MKFQHLSDNARIWVYQANRVFSSVEIDLLNQMIATFVAQWTAHDNALKAAFQIIHNRFIILAVDETMVSASGCSIDKSVALMKNIEQKFQVNLFDRLNFAFQNTNSEIFTATMQDIKRLIEGKLLTADTLFFDNTVTKNSDLEQKWFVAAKDSWLKRFFV